MKKVSILVLVVIMMTMVFAGCASAGTTGVQPQGESTAADAADDPNAEWLTNVSWTGTEVKFAAVQEMTLAGISVFVEEQEFEGVIISNSSGNMGLPGGATALPGSKLRFTSNPVIIFAGTVASCEIETDSVTPDTICFYLKSGEVLEVSLADVQAP